MRQEGTPAWMQVVDGVGNRPSRRPVAARRRPESTPIIPAKAESHSRHSGEGRNPVVYLIHPRPGGDDHPLSGAATLKRQGRIQHPGNPCLDSGFRRNDDTGGIPATL